MASSEEVAAAEKKVVRIDLQDKCIDSSGGHIEKGKGERIRIYCLDQGLAGMPLCPFLLNRRCLEPFRS
jgi:hypothetical protein